MATSRLLTGYVMASMAYRFVRKISDIKNAYVTVRDYDIQSRERVQKRVPMLYTDRIAVMTISTLASPYLFPKYLYDDLSGVEVYLRRANPMDYGAKEKHTIIDYMF